MGAYWASILGIFRMTLWLSWAFDHKEPERSWDERSTAQLRNHSTHSTVVYFYMKPDYKPTVGLPFLPNQPPFLYRLLPSQMCEVYKTIKIHTEERRRQASSIRLQVNLTWVRVGPNEQLIHGRRYGGDYWGFRLQILLVASFSQDAVFCPPHASLKVLSYPPFHHIKM